MILGFRERSITQVETTIHARSQCRIVGGDQGTKPVATGKLKEGLENRLRRSVVQVPRWFVREEDPWRMNDGARDRHSLTLAARQIARAVIRAAAKAKPLKQGASITSRSGAPASGDSQRQRHIFKCGELRQQVMELVDEAKMVSPRTSPIRIAHGRAVSPADPDLAGVRAVQKPGDLKERALAGA